jgi:hypothetical protein
VEGLYRFTLYALPLTTLGVAFGSDWHLSLPVSFRDVHPAITHRGGNHLPIRSGKSLMSMTFATASAVVPHFKTTPNVEIAISHSSSAKR